MSWHSGNNQMFLLIKNKFLFTEKETNEEKQCKQGSMDIVSAAIMAKVLEEREKERSQAKHCDSCTCPVIGEF